MTVHISPVRIEKYPKCENSPRETDWHRSQAALAATTISTRLPETGGAEQLN